MTRTMLGAQILHLALSSSAAARIWVVATNGSDANVGTTAAPFRTIQHAVDLARAGDTVSVRGGTYHPGRLLLRHSGIKRAPITLRNFLGERPRLDCDASFSPPRYHRVELQSIDGWRKAIVWIVIEGLEITGGWDGIKLYNAHDVVIRNCSIHDCLSQGILGSGTRITIDSNVIHSVGVNPMGLREEEHDNKLHGIYGTGGR